MIHVPTLTGTFPCPPIMFTLTKNEEGADINQVSASVLATLPKEVGGLHVRAFGSPEEMNDFFLSSGLSASSGVALVDRSLGRRHFHSTTRSRSGTAATEKWMHGAQWIVEVGGKCRPEGCARQLLADFQRNFAKHVNQGKFPWGLPKKGEKPPVPVMMPQTIAQLIANLNSGPDLAHAVADTVYAAELPPGSRISWYRVPHDPLEADVPQIDAVLEALRSFEAASGELIRENKDVQELMLAGVDLPPSSPISRAYLFPNVPCFSVSRPDLHYTGPRLPFASEIDEMPGGMPELVHLDMVYGINQDRWKKAFDWLCGDGLLVFLVSNEWSKCYIPETEWLVGHLKEKGYPVELLTTDRLHEVEFRPNGLFLRGERIATIWRQFPIFEAKGLTADVVMTAYEGKVRLFPEFAPYGNKSLFSIFRSHASFYSEALEPDVFEILDQVLPHSYIVGGNQQSQFPFAVSGHTITGIHDLRHAPKSLRDSAVLKVCGANTLAARSKGVLMGNGIEAGEWMDWIDTRLATKQPFIVQHRLEQGVARLAVMNTKTKYPEVFSCRILARPWTFNGNLVSIHGCAVPSTAFKVHGRVDMAIVPFSLPSA